LTEGKIASKHGHTRSAESIGKRDQQRSVAIRTGTVRQHHAIAAGNLRLVQESSHPSLLRIIGKLTAITHPWSF
jgi:hypothetical protein